MPKFFNTSTGQELTAGQALDVFLASDKAKLIRGATHEIGSLIHAFADAAQGYYVSKIIEEVGIEIKFGETNEQSRDS